MAKAREEARPVEGLRQQVTALEAAMALVMGDPLKKPVHRLRTTTRRIEAQLELLGMLRGEDAGIRAALRESAKVRKLLGEVRQAAGKVRDLDVQTEMVKKAVAGESLKGLLDEAAGLEEFLDGRRRKAADALVKKLEGHALELGPKLEVMMKLLEPAQEMEVADTRLVELTRGWYERGVKAAGKEDSEERLHGIRKRAKLARYIAEGGGEVAAKTGAEFEELQEIGGKWHDALTLRQLAKKRLGKKAGLTEMFAVREGRALAAYKRKLAARG